MNKTEALARIRAVDDDSDRCTVIDALMHLGGATSQSARGTLRSSSGRRVGASDIERLTGFFERASARNSNRQPVDSELASAALYAIGAVGGNEDLEYLTDAAVDYPSGQMVVEAVESISRIGGPVAFRLLDIMSRQLATDVGRHAAFIAKEKLLTGGSFDFDLDPDNELAGVRVHDVVSEFGGTKAKDIASRISSRDPELAAEINDIFAQRFRKL